MEKEKKENKKKQEVEKKENPEYVSPKITSYTNEEILDQIGPAHGGDSAPAP